MKINNYGIADTTHVYHYTIGSAADGNAVEYEATNKQELEQALESGKVSTFRFDLTKAQNLTDLVLNFKYKNSS